METHTINKLTWHPNRLFHLSCVIRETGNFFNFSISPKAYGTISNNLSEKSINKHLKRNFEQISNDYKYATIYQPVLFYI